MFVTDTPPPVKRETEKRRCERNHIQQKFKLHISNYAELSCISTDISLGGIALDCTTPIQEELNNLPAYFYLDGSETKFNCTIIRNELNHIAIKLDKKQAATFGKQLTKKLLAR